MPHGSSRLPVYSLLYGRDSGFRSFVARGAAIFGVDSKVEEISKVEDNRG